MRKILLSVVILVLTASMAFAQDHRVGIFADSGGASCAVNDAAAGLLAFYILEINAPGSTGCEYSAPLPSCYTSSGASFLSDTQVFSVNIGNSQTGISTAFGACLVGDIHVLTINTFAQGATGPCCVYPLLPQPINGLNYTDCGSPFPTKFQLDGGQSGLINPVTPGCECADIIPTESTTWGSVKAMWSNELH
jgi:hypothetical protein